MTKDCQDYLVGRVNQVRLVFLGSVSQAHVDFVDHKVTQELMGFQGNLDFQVLQVKPCPVSFLEHLAHLDFQDLLGFQVARVAKDSLASPGNLD